MTTQYEPKPLPIDPYKVLDILSHVTHKLLTQAGSTFHTHRNHLIPYYPTKESLYTLIFVASCVFRAPFNMAF